MQLNNNHKIIYSPSDLTTFLGCHHASHLDIKDFTENMARAENDSTAQLLQEKGIEHEKAYLQLLKNEGKSVIEIPKNPQPQKLQERVKLTLEAMRSGVDVIYQAVFCASPEEKRRKYWTARRCGLPA